jgi:tRNA/rRNA methyltransferase
MKLTKGDRGGIERLPPAPVVILCRPQIGENIGATARAMLNFGLTELRLVQPECGWPNAKAVAMASGAVAVLNELRLFESLAEATADLHHLFATTARPRELKKPVMDGAAAAGEARAMIDAGRRVGIVFGAERTGLKNEELLLADALVSFATNPAFSSLNLGQSVLLMSYEWGRAAGLRIPASSGGSEGEAATKGEVEGLLSQLIASLEEVQFFKSPDSRARLGQVIKVMIEKRGWTRPELNLMRGIVKELLTGRRQGPPS